MKKLITLILIIVAIILIVVFAGRDTQAPAVDETDVIDMSDTMNEPQPATFTIPEVATSRGELTTLVQSVVAADLLETLSTGGEFTVFAPTNEAFDELPEGTLNQLLEPALLTDLQGVLTYHVVPGVVFAEDLVDGMTLATANADLDLLVSVDEETGDVMVGEATVIEANIEASNGVIHIIDTVLLPPVSGDASADAEVEA